MSKDSQGEEQKVVQFTKKLPKPAPLLPDNIDAFENEAHTGESEALKQARAQFEQSQQILEQAIVTEAHLKLAENISALDIKNIAELCKAEPWKKGSLTEIATSNFGFIPEKFEAAAAQYPQESDEYTQLMEACHEARNIYWDQIKRDVNNTLAQLNKHGRSSQAVRSDCETINDTLRTGYKKFEGNPVYKNQYGRLLWAALALGRVFTNAHSPEKSSGTANYKQHKLVLDPFHGPDIRSVE